jgi:hypothetical protein
MAPRIDAGGSRPRCGAARGCRGIRCSFAVPPSRERSCTLELPSCADGPGSPNRAERRYANETARKRREDGRCPIASYPPSSSHDGSSVVAMVVLSRSTHARDFACRSRALVDGGNPAHPSTGGERSRRADSARTKLALVEVASVGWAARRDERAPGRIRASLPARAFLMGRSGVRLPARASTHGPDRCKTSRSVSAPP